MRTALFHQPHFLPWPGYISRCLFSDFVIFLTDVNYKKGYFHNRTKIINENGDLLWLTLPINNKTTNDKINLVEIASPPLFKKWLRVFRLVYQAEKDFQEIWQMLNETFEASYPSLSRFNQLIIQWTVNKICSIIEKPPPRFHESSKFIFSSCDRTERLMIISKMLDIDTILMGTDSILVHDIKQIENNSIFVKKHIHFSSVQTVNKTYNPLVSGLSFFHYVFKQGWKNASNSLINEWGIIDIYNHK